MSAIAKTASITLITGTPGSGKSLRTAWYLRDAVKAEGEGMVFACNINGLNIEGVTDFADPTKWEDLPAGSLLAVDEAQKFFRAERGEVPEYIKAMEEIRHRGVRLILLTQHPALIHPNIRALVGLHEHLVREDGKQLVTVYRRSRVIDNVRSDKALAVEDHETWAYPKDVFSLYKSAEIHTVKRTVKSKYKRAAALFVLAGLLVGYVVMQVRGGIVGESSASAAALPAAATPLAGGGGSAKPGEPVWRTATDYAKDHLPRFPTMPWTAPIYDDRAVTADPQLVCMSSLDGEDVSGQYREPSCTCLTEQGTVYEISQPECRRIARFGPIYNPYKQQQPHSERPTAGGVGGEPPTAMAAIDAAPSSGAILSAPQVSGYGDLGARRIETGSR